MNKTKLFIYFLVIVFISSCSVSKKLNYGKYERKITFSGYEWEVKNSNGRAGPGNNFFSNDKNSVWVDQMGHLHLKLKNYNGNWHCAEVVLTKTLGYGKYEFVIDADLDNLDRNIILGLFTWDDKARHYHREVDIEFARWGSQTTNLNAQYVVQPYNIGNNRYRYSVWRSGRETTHSFTWTRDSIHFQSFVSTEENSTANHSSLIQEWIYRGSYIPPSRHEKTRINLWLMQGKNPYDNMETEIIIRKFNFTPLK